MRHALWLTLFLLPHAALAALPGRFVQITEGIYRSAQPSEEHFDSLKNEAGIRTIVSVNNDEGEIEAEARNAAAAGIRFISVPFSGFFAPSDENVNQVLQALDDRANWPVLLHCQHGRDRTGLITGLYRVEFQKWAPKKAFTEMLERGFRRVLFPLEGYFRARTGYKGLRPAAVPAPAFR
jgi:tyrosine-protein phosphatase SIW14